MHFFKYTILLALALVPYSSASPADADAPKAAEDCIPQGQVCYPPTPCCNFKRCLDSYFTLGIPVVSIILCSILLVFTHVLVKVCLGLVSYCVYEPPNCELDYLYAGLVRTFIWLPSKAHTNKAWGGCNAWHVLSCWRM